MIEEKTAKKLSMGSVVAVFVAYTCSVSSIPNGGLIGQGLSFGKGMMAIGLFFVLAAAVAILVSWIGYKTGVTKDIVFKAIFGRRGFMLCSLIFAFCQAFWACFDFFNAGQALYNLMPEGSVMKNFGFCLAVVIMLVLTILGGVFGIMGVKWISTLTIPIGIILFLIIYAFSFKQAGGFEGLMAYVPGESTMTVASGAQLLFGMWMAGYVGMMDLTPEAKNTRSVVVAGLCAAAFIALCFMVGQVGFIGTGMMTVGDICMSLGGAIFILGNLFVLVAQGNTTPACNYMYSLSFSEGLKLSRKTLAIIVPLIVAAISFYIMYGAGVDFVSTIINVVSCLMAPLVGVVIAEFYIVSKRNMEIKPEEEYPIVNPAAMISLLVGLVFSLVFTYAVALPLGNLITILIAIALQCILRLGAKMK